MNTHQKASNKAFAKLTMLSLEKEKLEQDLSRKITGGLTLDEVESLRLSYLQEIKIWSYIASLIEKNS